MFRFSVSCCDAVVKVRLDLKHLIRIRKTSCCGSKYSVLSPQTWLGNFLTSHYKYPVLLLRTRLENVSLKTPGTAVGCLAVVAPGCRVTAILCFYFIKFQLTWKLVPIVWTSSPWCLSQTHNANILFWWLGRRHAGVSSLWATAGETVEINDGLLVCRMNS